MSSVTRPYSFSPKTLWLTIIFRYRRRTKLAYSPCKMHILFMNSSTQPVTLFISLKKNKFNSMGQGVIDHSQGTNSASCYALIHEKTNSLAKISFDP